MSDQITGKAPELKEELYLSIGNSGAEFKIFDKAGPTIVVTTGAYGNINTTVEIFTNKQGLKEIGEMFLRASEGEFSEPYCYVARPMSEISPSVAFTSGEPEFGSDFSMGDDKPMDISGNQYEVCESCQ